MTGAWVGTCTPCARGWRQQWCPAAARSEFTRSPTWLLDSPRWASSAQQRLTTLSLGGCPGVEDGLPAYPFPAMHAWVTEELGAFKAVGGLLRCAPRRHRRTPKELEGLLGLARKCLQLRVLQIDARGRRDWAPKSIAALAAGAAQHWPQLEHLGLVDGARSVVLAAANKAPWQRLRHLNLSVHWLGFDGAKAAAAAPDWPQLQLLDLTHTGLGSRGVQALMRGGAKHWPLLQCSRLGGNHTLRAKGAEAIAAAAQHMPLLTELNVHRCQLGPKGARALAAAAQHWPCMQRLHMSFNRISPEGARAHAASHPTCD